MSTTVRDMKKHPPLSLKLFKLQILRHMQFAFVLSFQRHNRKEQSIMKKLLKKAISKLLNALPALSAAVVVVGLVIQTVGHIQWNYFWDKWLNDTLPTFGFVSECIGSVISNIVPYDSETTTVMGSLACLLVLIPAAAAIVRKGERKLEWYTALLGTIATFAYGWMSWNYGLDVLTDPMVPITAIAATVGVVSYALNHKRTMKTLQELAKNERLMSGKVQDELQGKISMLEEQIDDLRSGRDLDTQLMGQLIEQLNRNDPTRATSNPGETQTQTQAQ